ncbi:hypothetical protein CBOM_00006 [Ceraceosorus bombacis]|uniref:Uncharacterized protein n=1 Tax=Ceraceosorus bombacis TaxID=401625 RepID=A0A0P1B8Y7_9BASI|nr:hypothetical protein CBOM_00006 [Ceraceosorus bombacis]
MRPSTLLPLCSIALALAASTRSLAAPIPSHNESSEGDDLTKFYVDVTLPEDVTPDDAPGKWTTLCKKVAGAHTKQHFEPDADKPAEYKAACASFSVDAKTKQITLTNRTSDVVKEWNKVKLDIEPGTMPYRIGPMIPIDALH